MIFKCKKCGKENDVSEIYGSCKSCDNKDAESFEPIISKEKLFSINGVRYLAEARTILISALKKEKVFIIDPKSHINVEQLRKRLNDN
ncbi:hypothetical protein [Bacillus pseudomycoides]|uniref:hypothetical protein n=1 Tax=Bacillus pseudomycoides TaxID=64104 RepID=UPI000BEBE551|nr:hypothetical protein [Bacillus pseudomycoides]PEB42232.1 hypothetical protein COO06_07930 [Bacillus pseudomycoides]PGA62191.1 hypothetical protein COL84_13530 [Bacillus pseudomycoides]